jgi:hypothetical protein
VKFSSLRVPGAREGYRDNAHPFKPWHDDASAKGIGGRGVPASQRRRVASLNGETERERKKERKIFEFRAGRNAARSGPLRDANSRCGPEPLAHLHASGCDLYTLTPRTICRLLFPQEVRTFSEPVLPVSH